MLLLSAVLALTSCKPKAPVPGSPDPDAPEYADDIAASEALQQALTDMDGLDEPDGVVRGVLNEEGLTKALADKNNKILRLHGDVEGDVTVAAGDYTDRSFIFEAPNAAVVCDADVGSVTLTALNENGFTLNGTANTVYVNGGDIKLTLNNSVKKLYIIARDAEVTLTNGSFPVIYCDNSTDVITNKTDAAVQLILANGTTREIPAGKTYNMDTGELTRAKG